MKKRIIILISILLPLLGYAQKEDIYQRPVQHERSHDYDAIHYKVSLNVDLDSKSLTGNNEITLSPFSNGLNECILDAESLFVTRVLDSNGSKLSFEQKDNKLKIDLGKIYDHSDIIKINVEYLLDKPVLGLRFFDETPDNPQMASSDCFPNKSRQWIPIYDYPHDKATMEMIVTVDKKHKVLSNGRLAGVKDNGDGTHTWHWSQEQPHSTYLISLSIGDFAVIEDSLGSLPVNYWVYHYHVDDAKRSFSKTPHMIDFFNKLYDYEYPWAKYDQVISPYMGGGAEATSATLLGEAAVTDESGEIDFSYEGVIAHEIAHQWWGDLITCRSWEHTWLNESFGTYSDYLYARNEFGEEEGAYNLLGKKNGYLREARNRYIRPIVFNRYESPGQNFDSHTYPKGANILHLLRHILGDDTFFRTISAFLHKYEFQPVDTHDFMKTVKEVSGRNMDWFFEQYIFKPGHLVADVSKSWDEESKTLRVFILQKQDSLPRVPIYKVPVNLGFTFPGGRKLVKEVWLNDKLDVFEFKFDSEPVMVRFDEGNFLIKEWTYKKPLKELLFQAENDDMIGRLWAVEQLANFSGDQATIDLWLRSAEDDPFWAVRKAALDQIGNHAVKGNLDLVKESLEDENSKVRQSAVRILGDQKDPGMIKMLKNVYENDESYLVQSEALRSIGKCGGKKELAYIQKATERKTTRGVVERAAKEVIGLLE